MRPLISPAPTMGQGQLDNDLRKSDSSNIPSSIHPKLPLGKNRIMVLEQIADKWFRRGLYQSPSKAMQALLGGVE
jgi:hypothetical protein